MRKIIGYKLSPVEPSSGFGTAALLTCSVTGKMLSSSGGGSLAISPEVKQAITEDEEVQELIRRKIALLESNPTA